jgi:hypothetical protein
MEHWRNDNSKETNVLREKHVPTSTVNQKTHMDYQGLNQGLQSEKPANIILTCSTVSRRLHTNA